MNIVLIGMPGSGKSTIAKKFASISGIKFYDSDLYIEHQYKLTVNQIFDKFGEDKFREYEHLVLKELLKKDSFIIAAGGGLPCFYDNMDRIKQNGISVYLKVPPKILINRITEENSKIIRPLLVNKSEKELLKYIENILEKRKIHYERADYIIDGTVSAKEILRNYPFNL